ncbi:DUF975 family protein [Butyrivibrio sp. AE3004]|uniref:DUF975 family protein n=1 Tax=Butyrivibrio sp. AE3004 TaxID=1506994 RepID=UPI0005623F8C|nr:DUF975 family protein [Butyrivibrio sp. AE3004]
MWTNSQLKANGLMNFKKNRWACIVVTIILGICVGGTASGSANSASNNEETMQELMDKLTPEIIAAIVGVIGIAVIIGIILDIILFNVLEVGCQRFFIVNRAVENAQISEVTFGFKNNWMNIVKTMFLKDLYLFLWSMLCFIPGIIKAYSYRLVPYLMAEDPNMSSNEAITLSRQMMNGQKMNAFVYDLSFIGWYLLAIITCGIAGVFYVFPYKNCSDAELYTAIKETYNPNVQNY